MTYRLVVVVIAVLALPGAADAQRRVEVRAAADGVYAAAYNINYDEALRLSHQLVASHPDESAAHRALATVVWMQVLFDRGGLTMDHYLATMSQGNVNLPQPSAAKAALFRQHVDRAIALAAERVRRVPGDVDARYDLGVAHGLLASWIGTVEGRVTAAFGSARRAFEAHEWVLKRAPARHEAGLIVGTYRYAVSSLSFPKRWLAYLVGFGGNKELSVQLLTSAATAPLTRTDARMALALIHSRDGRHREALAILIAVLKEYPDNRLFQLEAASAALRAGLAEQAEELLTAGLAWHDRDPRPKMPGERALWIYKRGSARVLRGHLDPAVADLRLALAQSPAGWVEGRVHLELGKVADLRGQRPAALAEYNRARTLCAMHRDPWCVDHANALRSR